MADKITLTKQHLSFTASGIVFFLLSHNPSLTLTLRLGCGAIVIGLLIWMHLLYRRA